MNQTGEESKQDVTKDYDDYPIPNARLVRQQLQPRLLKRILKLNYLKFKDEAELRLTIPGPAGSSSCLTVEHSQLVIDGISCSCA